VNRHDLVHRARRGIAPFSLLLVLLPAGTATAVTAQAAATVAQMGAIQFTVSDLKDFLQTLPPESRRQALADPQAMNRLIQAEVARRAVLNEALAKKWQLKPAVAKQIGMARDTIVLRNYLTAVVNLPAGYPSEAETKAAYDLNRDKFLMPRQYHLAQIFIASAPGDKNAEAAQKKASDLAAKARARGARFDELARQNSQYKPGAAKGGDMGWAMEDQIQPAVLAKVAGMARGDVSDPIHSSLGWHIVRLIDTKPAAPRPLAEVRGLIATSLRQQKEQSEVLQYLARLVDKTPVRLNQANLRTALEAAR